MSLSRLLLVSCLFSATASAAVSLSFTKSGTDLIITVNSPVTYISTISGNTNMVMFKGVSTAFGNGFSSTSTATLTTDFFSTPIPIIFDNTWGSGLNVNASLTPADTFVTSTSSHPVGVGTAVTLSTGTITLSDYDGPAPVNGNYETYLVSGFAIASQAGTSIPEASSLAMLGGLLVIPLRRRSR